MSELFWDSLDGMIELYRGDARCLDMLKIGSVDMAIVDPPYNSPASTKSGGTTRRFKRWIDEDKQGEFFKFDLLELGAFHDFFSAVLYELKRTVKPGGHVYWFTQWWKLPDFMSYLNDEEFGFKMENLLVWDKVAIGLGYRWRHRLEYIIFASRLGAKCRPLNNKGWPNLISVKRIPPKKLVHPNEKPIDVVEALILNSTQPGDIVLSPFLGSGPEAWAAAHNNRKFIGVEINERWIEVAKDKFNQESFELWGT